MYIRNTTLSVLFLCSFIGDAVVSGADLVSHVSFIPTSSSSGAVSKTSFLAPAKEGRQRRSERQGNETFVT